MKMVYGLYTFKLSWLENSVHTLWHHLTPVCEIARDVQRKLEDGAAKNKGSSRNRESNATKTRAVQHKRRRL